MLSPQVDSSNNNQSKTNCPFCGRVFWNWHIKRHLQWHLNLQRAQNQHENNLQANCGNNNACELQNHLQHDMPCNSRADSSSSFAWSPPWNSNSHDYDSSETGHDSEDSDSCSQDTEDENDMFDDERHISVDTYIKTLSDEKYDPQRVLKYLSWSPRPLSIVEQEAVRFLRNLAFGTGTSRAHSKEWLLYIRDLGGTIQNNQPTTLTLSIVRIVTIHLQPTLPLTYSLTLFLSRCPTLTLTYTLNYILHR